MTPNEAWGVAQTVISLAAVAIGLPSIILWLLNRKNANKKLDIEEGGLDVSVFAEQRQAYSDLLRASQEATAKATVAASSAQAAADAALAEAAAYKQERETLVDTVREQGDKLERLRKLFQSYVERVGVPLTEDELEEFEATKPHRPSGRSQRRERYEPTN